MLASYASASSIITVGTVNESSRAVLGGTVIPYKEVTFTAQVPGQIEYLGGDVGDSFKAGDVLVRINDDELRSKRRAALAKLGNARAALRNSQVQYNRELYSPSQNSLYNHPGMGLPTMFDSMFTRPFANMAGVGGNPAVDRQAQLYSRYTGVDKARSSVRQAHATIQRLDARIRDTRSVAPFDGIIMAKPVETGDTVQPGQPLITFGHTKYLRIRAQVPTRLVKNLQVGMRVPAKLDSMDKRIETRVARIFPLANPRRHTVTVKFDLPIDAPGGPGMYAEVMVPAGQSSQKPAPVIPRSAVLRGGSLPGVLVVDNQGHSELRLVRLGSRAQDGRVKVLSGLKAGTRIIDNPPPGAASGWMPKKAAATH